MSYYPGEDTYTGTVDAECEDCEIQWEQEVEVERGQYLIKCPKCGYEGNREVRVIIGQSKTANCYLIRQKVRIK